MFPLNIPNALTMLRILAVPVVVVALLDETPNGDTLAAVVFALAALTDGQQLATADRVGGKCQFGARFAGDLRQPTVRDRQSVRATVGQHPRSAGGDADRDHAHQRTE